MAKSKHHPDNKETDVIRTFVQSLRKPQQINIILMKRLTQETCGGWSTCI